MQVLLVDDHALFREGMALLLQRLDQSIETLHAGSCEEAFQRMSEARVDLVLMDLGLPGMSGLAGIAALRERYPERPLVALSSSDDRESVLRAIGLGAMGFIPKSSSSDVMIAAIRVILAKGIYLPPGVVLGPSEMHSRRSDGAPEHRARRPVQPSDLGLTQRQADVLYLILQGKPAKLISRELGISTSTVKSHTSAVLRALNVTTRVQAVVAAGKLGLTFE